MYYTYIQTLYLPRTVRIYWLIEPRTQTGNNHYLLKIRFILSIMVSTYTR